MQESDEKDGHSVSISSVPKKTACNQLSVAKSAEKDILCCVLKSCFFIPVLKSKHDIKGESKLNVIRYNSFCAFVFLQDREDGLARAVDPGGLPLPPRCPGHELQLRVVRELRGV